MLIKKLKAGALQLTLFIAVIIMLMLMGFVLLVHLQKHFTLQTDFIVETSRSASDAIIQATKVKTTLNDTIFINGDADSEQKLKLHRSYWGVFEKVVSISGIKKHRVQKAALIGAQKIHHDRPAIYLKNNNRPLVMVGNSKITGSAFLSEQGVRTGNISGQSFYGKKLIHGTTELSAALPRLQPELIDILRTIETHFLTINSEQFITIDEGDSHSNSFLSPIQLHYSKSSIDLYDIKLIGNIVIQSEAKISVDKSALLKDVILIAPEIEIQDGVEGNFQAIASNKILVGKQVQLKYPTALIIKEQKNKLGLDIEPETTSEILIDEHAKISGYLLYLGITKEKNFDAQIKLNENSLVVGEVYCNQNLELLGTVHGSIFTNNFVARQSGSVYQNHIYNGVINVLKLPEQYVGLNFKDSKQNVMKWLY